MRIIQAKAEILDKWNPREIIHRINVAGRTCYKSEAKDEEAEKQFVRNLVARGHEAMLEHASMTVRFTVDRGISHELVRHRLASFAQESTRYCNYSQDKFGEEITVIEPCFFNDISENVKEGIRDRLFVWFPDEKDAKMRQYVEWLRACRTAEAAYFRMLKEGATPEEARSVLPNSLKTEVIMTANLREWRHFFKLRAAGETGKPHPQMLEVAVPLLKECREWLPEVFGDIQPMEEKEK
jgi:thymidylate synthase (FAD)